MVNWESVLQAPITVYIRPYYDPEHFYNDIKMPHMTTPQPIELLVQAYVTMFQTFAKRGVVHS